jgi:prepilin-type N-terminal cleavage/methylation domain-containing protein
MSAARPRLSDERGFTLPELITSMTIGLIVLLAAAMLLDRAFTASGDTADRTDALQRGRQAMELITRQLRSQVCVGSTNVPIAAADANSVTFYGSLAESNTNVQRHTITWAPSATKGTITQAVANGAGTYPDLTFGTPTSSTMLTKVGQIVDGGTPRPVFRYYEYRSGTTNGTLDPLTAPVTASRLGRIAMIKVGFRAYADRPLNNPNRDDFNSVVLEDDVYTRVADPTKPEDGARCI